MRPILLAAALCALLPCNAGGLSKSSRPSRTPLFTASQKLSCQLKCSEFKCDIPPSVDLSLPLTYNHTVLCHTLKDSSICHVDKTASQLSISFRGIHLTIFYRLIINSGNQIIFDDKPCIYEKPKVRLVGYEISVENLDGCHFDENVESRVVCRPESGAPFEKTYRFNNSQSYSLKADLRPFTNYNCSVQNRYEHFHESKCLSRWSEKEFGSTFRTDSAPPSAAPTPLGFLRHGSECSVYFQGVPAVQLNGELEYYKWKCGQTPGTSSKFSFPVDCSRQSSCVIWARNKKYSHEGPKSRSLLLKENGQRPRLQLWSEGSDFVRPVVEGGASPGSVLMICECNKCDGVFPECVSMTTKSLANISPFRVNFASQRVAVSQIIDSRPVMSDWVSCSYKPGAALRTHLPLNELVHVDTVDSPQGLSHQVVIPNAQLRCPQATRPIFGLKARRVCEQGGPPDIFVQRSSRAKSLEHWSDWTFFVPKLPGCELLLSADNESFVSVYRPQYSTELPPGAIAGIIIGVLLICVFLVLILKYRQVFVNGYRTICHEPNVRENDSNNGYGVPFYTQDDYNGYTSVLEESQSYHLTEDEGTRPIRDECDYRENYTVQS